MPIKVGSVGVRSFSLSETKTERAVAMANYGESFQALM
jgi:hypothetical protein